MNDNDHPFWLAVTLAADARGLGVSEFIRAAVSEKILADAVRYSAELTAEERAAIAIDLARAGIVVAPVTDTIH